MDTTQLQQIIKTVEAGGGIYRGVQEGFPEKGIKALVLFDAKDWPAKFKSTMCLPEDQVTAAAVSQAIRDKREAYARGGQAF